MQPTEPCFFILLRPDVSQFFRFRLMRDVRTLPRCLHMCRTTLWVAGGVARHSGTADRE